MHMTSVSNIVGPAVQRAPMKRSKQLLRLSSSRLGLLTLRVGLLVFVLLAWQVSVDVGLVDRFFLSEPSAVLSRLSELVTTSQLYTDIAFTMQSVLLGFVISAISGIGCACLMYQFPLLQKVLDPFILALYSTPRIALAPLFIIWFGIGAASKVALVVSLCFFIMLLNTYAGLTNVEPRLINQVRMMGAGRWLIFRRVSLPASIPWLLSGTRVSLGFALIGAVVGEMIIAERGLGLRMARASGLFDTTGVFAYIVVVAALGLLLDQVLRLAETRLTSWGPVNER